MQSSKKLICSTIMLIIACGSAYALPAAIKISTSSGATCDSNAQICVNLVTSLTDATAGDQYRIKANISADPNTGLPPYMDTSYTETSMNWLSFPPQSFTSFALNPNFFSVNGKEATVDSQTCAKLSIPTSQPGSYTITINGTTTSVKCSISS